MQINTVQKLTTFQILMMVVRSVRVYFKPSAQAQNIPPELCATNMARLVLGPEHNTKVTDDALHADIVFAGVHHAAVIPWEDVIAITDADGRGMQWRKREPIEQAIAEKRVAVADIPEASAPPAPSVGKKVLH